MKIKQAEFVISNSEINKLPKPKLPEFAFIGRSNVGKSSLINMLTERKNLAKTSSTPGKTQLINHFVINHSWYLVDLPGYGYAKLSKTKRKQMERMITDYILRRESLVSVFVLVDSRVKPQDIDMEFIEFLGLSQIPFVLVLTKMDKLNQKEKSISLKNYKVRLEQDWEELPLIIESSSVKNEGRDEILNYIEENMQYFKPKV